MVILSLNYFSYNNILWDSIEKLFNIVYHYLMGLIGNRFTLWITFLRESMVILFYFMQPYPMGLSGELFYFSYNNILWDSMVKLLYLV